MYDAKTKSLMCQNGLFTICLSLVHVVLDRSKSTSTYCWSHLLTNSGNLVAHLIPMLTDNDYTGRQNLTKLQTLGPEYTFPKVLDALNPNLTSELLHHLRFFKFPDLKVKNRPFFDILGVILYTVRKFKNPEVMEQF